MIQMFDVVFVTFDTWSKIWIFDNGQLHFFNLVAKAAAGFARLHFIFPQLPGSYVSTQPGHKTHI